MTSHKKVDDAEKNKILRAAGELNVSMDGSNVVYPAFLMYGDSGMMEFKFGTGDGSSSNIISGMTFRISTQDYGKDITIPDATTWSYYIVNKVGYLASSGVMNINFNEEFHKAEILVHFRS